MVWLRKRVTITAPRMLTDPDPEARVIFVARHRDALFLPLVLPKTSRLRLAILSSGSRNGRFLSELCVSDADPGAVSFVRVRRGGDRRGKSRARLAATYQAIGVLKERSILLAVDRPDVVEFARGSLLIAKRSGSPMAPLVVRPNRLGYVPLWRWDRLRIPLPWCRLQVEVRKFVSVEPEATGAELKEVGEQLAMALGVTPSRPASPAVDGRRATGAAGERS